MPSAVTIHWSWEAQIVWCPNLLIGACAHLAPPPMGGGATWNSGGSCEIF